MADLPQQQYQAPMPPPPPPKKKGLSPWLLCGIVACGLPLVGCIIVVILAVSGVGMLGSFYAEFKQAAEVTTEIQSTDLATVKAAAVQVDGETLVLSIAAYEGQWIELVDVIAAGTDEMRQAGGNQGTGYMLESGLILTDMSNTSSAQAGDKIHAWGKVISFEILEKAEIQEDGIAPVMFFAKAIEVQAASQDEPADEVEADAGELDPAEATP